MDNKHRRSSILKRAATQPSSPILSRRISFHEKKTVKEFSEGTDKVTIWHNSYEEEAVGLQASSDKENMCVSGQNHISNAIAVAPSYTYVMDLDDAMDLTPLGEQIIEANKLVEMEINSGRKSQPARRISSTSNMDMTFLEDGARAQVVAEIEQEIRQLQRSSHLQGVLLFGDDEQDEFYKSLDEITFDNTSLDGCSAKATPLASHTSFSDRMNLTHIATSAKVPLASASRTMYESSLDYTNVSGELAKQSATMYDGATLDFTHIPAVSATTKDPVTMAQSQTMYEGSLDYTNVSGELAKQSETIYDGAALDFTHIPAAKDAPAMFQSQTMYEGSLDCTNVSTSSPVVSQTMYGDQLDMTNVQSTGAPIMHRPNKTIQLNQSIDNDSICVSVQPTSQLSKQTQPKKHEESLNFTQLPSAGNEENASLEYNEATFHMRPGLCSTKIGFSESVISIDMDQSSEVQFAPRIEVGNSVAQAIEHAERLDTDQRQFDRTMSQMVAAPNIEEMSDSVLVNEPQEASSSMRLFRTNSSNTTEELCNLNAEELCKVDIKSGATCDLRVDSRQGNATTMAEGKAVGKQRKSERLRNASMRMSDLAKHINVTLSTSNDDDDHETDDKDLLKSDLKVESSNEERPKGRRRCSIGTPDESAADLCRQCAGCLQRRSLTPLGHIPLQLERFPFVEAKRRLTLDTGDYDRLSMYASLDDVLSYHDAQNEAMQMRRLARTGISLNVPSPGPIFLLNNLLEVNRSAIQSTVTDEEHLQATPAPFPTPLPLQLMLENAFESRTPNIWHYDGLFFYRGRLRFINKRIPSVILFGHFDYSAWQSHNTRCAITFTQFRVEACPLSTQSHMSALSRLRHNQLLNELPPEVFGSCETSDQLMGLLDRLDASHHRPIYDECAKFDQVITAANGIVLQTGGQCFVKKRIFNVERLERQTIIVKIESIRHTTAQHIFTDPLLELRPNAADELGAGLDCIERILVDPFRYLVRDERPAVGGVMVAR